MSDSIDVLFAGGFTILAAVLVTVWQFGGSRAIMRRRLLQELEILNKIPREWKLHSEYERYVALLTDEYLLASKQLRLWPPFTLLVIGGVIVIGRDLLHDRWPWLGHWWIGAAGLAIGFVGMVLPLITTFLWTRPAYLEQRRQHGDT